MSNKTKTLSELIAEADARGSALLADANEAAERGQKKKAERLYARAQFWLDKSNRLQEAKWSAK
jgi:hypothetical protein